MNKKEFSKGNNQSLNKKHKTWKELFKTMKYNKKKIQKNKKVKLKKLNKLEKTFLKNNMICQLKIKSLKLKQVSCHRN